MWITFIKKTIFKIHVIVFLEHKFKLNKIEWIKAKVDCTLTTRNAVFDKSRMLEWFKEIFCFFRVIWMLNFFWIFCSENVWMVQGRLFGCENGGKGRWNHSQMNENFQQISIKVYRNHQVPIYNCIWNDIE
jgi:hypothetical protein